MSGDQIDLSTLDETQRWEAAVGRTLARVDVVTRQRANPADRKDLDDDIEDVVDAEEAILRDVRLSASQREQVQALRAACDQQLIDYWSVRIPDMQAIIEGTRNQVRAVLNPDQRIKYDDGMRELQADHAATRRGSLTR